MKLTCLFLSILLLISCKKEIRPFKISQKEIGKYFYLQKDSAFLDGRMRNLYYPQTVKGINGDADEFIEKYDMRFDYLFIKEMKEVLEVNSLKGKTYEQLFADRIKSNKFYKNFSMLLPADTPIAVFTKDEMMLVASRFFYCDTVIKKGDKIGVGWHVCVGINGLSEMKNCRDLGALEAFAFEFLNPAISKKKKPVFYQEFKQYVAEANKKEKPTYTDDKTHLEKVRAQVYKLMENNKDLQQALLNNFEKKKRSVGFSIQ